MSGKILLFFFFFFAEKFRSVSNGPRNRKYYNADLIYIENLFISYLKDKLGKRKAMLKVKQCFV